MRRTAYLLLLAFVWIVSSPQSIHAEQLGEMLEKGIYQEETLGDLDKAIATYRKIVADAKDRKAVAAKAQFRMAQCLKKQGKESEAIEAFKRLVEEFPESKELVAQAKRQLPAAVTLSDAPWKPGERVTMRMQLAGGQTIGVIGLGVDQEVVNERRAWRMLVRRFITSGHNEGVSKAWIDQTTNHPLKTSFEHTLLGDAFADWSATEIKITQKNALAPDPISTTIALTEPVFCNDQWLFGIRQLPLKVGYKVDIPLRVAFTKGTPVTLQVEVATQEKVETPLGEFECYRLDTNILQTFWVTNTPERYVAKFEAQGVTAVISSVVHEPTQTYQNEKFGVSAQLSKDWFIFETEPRKGYLRTAIVAPQMAASHLTIKPKSRLEQDQRQSVKAWADSELESALNDLENGELEEGSRKSERLAGHLGESFSVDFSFGKRPMKVTRSYAFAGDHAIELSFITTANAFAKATIMQQELRKKLKIEAK